MATQYLEEMIFNFLDNHLTIQEKRDIHNGYDAEKHLDEETQDEMRDALYKYVLNNVAWYRIIAKLKADIESESETESESESEED